MLFQRNILIQIKSIILYIVVILLTTRVSLKKRDFKGPIIRDYPLLYLVILLRTLPFVMSQLGVDCVPAFNDGLHWVVKPTPFKGYEKMLVIRR